MPNHNHNNGQFTNIIRPPAATVAVNNDVDRGFGDIWNNMAPMASVGGNGAHNNIPPYLVLIRCKKIQQTYATLYDVEAFIGSLKQEMSENLSNLENIVEVNISSL